MNLEEVFQKINDKNFVISFAKNKSNRSFVIEKTSWLPADTPIKIRLIALKENYTSKTFPKCHCGNYVTWNKTKRKNDPNFFRNHCSSKCARKSKIIPIDKDWLYQKRIVEMLAYEDIGKLIGTSEIPIKRACKQFNIPMVKYNESNALTTSFLRNKQWLTEQHINNKRTLDDISAEIKSNKATLSRWLQYHQIIANNPNIYPRQKIIVSKECQEVIDFLQQYVEVKINDRTILNGKELDIVIPQFNLAIEYNGVYSHIFREEHQNESLRKDRNYHLNKTLECQNQGYQLLHIFSDDWIHKKDIWKSMLLYKINKIPQHYNARDCRIVTLDKNTKNNFLNNNHIQGKDMSQINYGLLLDQQVVAVMTFAKSRYNKNYDWELVRFCSRINTNIRGGFSRLLSAFEKEHTGSIISYADRTRSDGNVYNHNGFEILKYNPPSYSYVNLNKSVQRLHRQGFVKKRIAPGDPRPEWEIMKERGYERIWDCGTIAMIKNRAPKCPINS